MSPALQVDSSPAEPSGKPHSLGKMVLAGWRTLSTGVIVHVLVLYPAKGDLLWRESRLGVTRSRGQITVTGKSPP